MILNFNTNKINFRVTGINVSKDSPTEQAVLLATGKMEAANN
jgi:hypothetical protein